MHNANVVPEPHGAKIESEKILGEGEQGKRARRRLDPKDPKWKNAKKRAAAEMGFMQPSECTHIIKIIVHVHWAKRGEDDVMCKGGADGSSCWTRNTQRHSP